MVTQMEKEGFGHCTNYQECVKVCPKGIPLDVRLLGGNGVSDHVQSRKPPTP